MAINKPKPAARGENIAKIILQGEYGYRRVLEELPRHETPSGGYRMWLCECLRCGRTQKLQAHEILNPQGEQCLRCRNRSRRKDDSPFKRVVSSYRRNARSRGLEWELSDDEVRHLFSLVCHYCGVGPSNFGRPSTTSASDPQPDRGIAYSGIDRIDNDKGYIVSNVVPCCKICNRAKANLSYLDFKAWIGKVIAYNVRS